MAPKGGWAAPGFSGCGRSGQDSQDFSDTRRDSLGMGTPRVLCGILKGRALCRLLGEAPSIQVLLLVWSTRTRAQLQAKAALSFDSMSGRYIDDSVRQYALP